MPCRSQAARTAAPRARLDRTERIGAGVELHVDKPHLVRRRPRDRVFQRQFAPDIDADPVAQRHRYVSDPVRTAQP